MREIGIIGLGNFGRFIAKHLRRYFRVTTYDRKIKGTSLKEAASKEIIILAVPVQNLESVLKKIKKYVKPGALVLDVCSVKVKPVHLMKKMLPKNVEILATHPLFGPQSGKNGIAGLTMVVCPVRTKRFVEIKALLKRKLKLNIVEMTPEEHDRLMAKTQALAHFVGRALKEMGIARNKLDLATYDCLVRLVDLIKYDSDELFEAIQRENPFAARERKRLLEKLERLEKAPVRPV